MDNASAKAHGWPNSYGVNETWGHSAPRNNSVRGSDEWWTWRSEDQADGQEQRDWWDISLLRVCLWLDCGCCCWVPEDNNETINTVMVSLGSYDSPLRSENYPGAPERLWREFWTKTELEPSSLTPPWWNERTGSYNLSDLGQRYKVDSRARSMWSGPAT